MDESQVVLDWEAAGDASPFKQPRSHPTVLPTSCSSEDESPSAESSTSPDVVARHVKDAAPRLLSKGKAPALHIPRKPSESNTCVKTTALQPAPKSRLPRFQQQSGRCTPTSVASNLPQPRQIPCNPRQFSNHGGSSQHTASNKMRESRTPPTGEGLPRAGLPRTVRSSAAPTPKAALGRPSSARGFKQQTSTCKDSAYKSYDRSGRPGLAARKNKQQDSNLSLKRCPPRRPLQDGSVLSSLSSQKHVTGALFETSESCGSVTSSHISQGLKPSRVSRAGTEFSDVIQPEISLEAELGDDLDEELQKMFVSSTSDRPDTHHSASSSPRTPCSLLPFSSSATYSIRCSDSVGTAATHGLGCKSITASEASTHDHISTGYEPCQQVPVKDASWCEGIETSAKNKSALQPHVLRSCASSDLDSTSSCHELNSNAGLCDFRESSNLSDFHETFIMTGRDLSPNYLGGVSLLSAVDRTNSLEDLSALEMEYNKLWQELPNSRSQWPVAECAANTSPSSGATTSTFHSASSTPCKHPKGHDIKESCTSACSGSNFTSGLHQTSLCPSLLHAFSSGSSSGDDDSIAACLMLTPALTEEVSALVRSLASVSEPGPCRDASFYDSKSADVNDANEASSSSSDNKVLRSSNGVEFQALDHAGSKDAICGATSSSLAVYGNCETIPQYSEAGPT